MFGAGLRPLEPLVGCKFGRSAPVSEALEVLDLYGVVLERGDDEAGAVLFVAVGGHRRVPKQERMLALAVEFANAYHGGDAVFAARLDRDEKGKHTVDVFLMPRYDFQYKDGRTQKRASVSKFSKEQARARSASLLDPGEKLDPEGPVMQGRAMQAAWFEHLREAGVRWVEPPKRKAVRSADRLEPEAHGLAQDRARLDAQRADLAARLADVEAREEAILKAARIIETARRMNGQPVPADLASIADRGRRRPGQGQGQDR